MFYLRTAIRNILRCNAKSILTICICIFIIIPMTLYWGNVESGRKQLRELADAIPIYCRITNLNGSREAGLEISEDKILSLQASRHVESPVFGVRLVAGEGAFPAADWKKHLDIPMMGVTAIKAVEGLSKEQVLLKEGINLGFLASTKHYCIVSRERMEKNQWKVGDTIALNLYYYWHESLYQLKIDPLSLTTFEIVGEMDGYFSLNSDYSQPEILVPFEAVREIYQEKGIAFTAESAAFYLTDPLKLNNFKEEMKALRLLPQSPNADDDIKGAALFVKDSIFISAANRLQQGLDTLFRFLPIVLITVVFIGYITSYLLVHSRQKDFSVMRSLGVSNKGVFAVFFLEQLLLATGGMLIGNFLSLLFVSRDGVVLLVVNLIFLVSFMGGNIITILRFSKRSVMDALSGSN